MTLFPDDVSPAAPTGPLVRVRATVAYDGQGFAGFALQSGQRKPTVAGVLREALVRALGHSVDITCAGRTDAGVHAWGQVISFDASVERFDADRLQRSLNKQLAPRVAVRDLQVAPEGFSARFDAIARRYRYTILRSPFADPLMTHTAWWVDEPLDLRLMRLGCDPLLGEHDFSAFCRRPKVEPGAPPRSLVRTVREARWEREAHPGGGEILRFWIEANAFCHQMVRSVVGTLVDVGRGTIRPGDLTAVLREGDRARAGTVAPPQGLILWEVQYRSAVSAAPEGAQVPPRP